MVLSGFYGWVKFIRIVVIDLEFMVGFGRNLFFRLGCI